MTLTAADFVLSATLVATTEYVPAVPGAVYRPPDVIVPPVVDHVTDVLLEPVTVDVNGCVAPVWIATRVGLIETTIGGALTVTLAEADLVLSATLVTVTVKVPGVLDAVYRPELDTEPPVADHVPAVFVVPVTVAANCCVAPVSKDADVGLIAITTGGAVTVTLAEAVFVVSATLVACTV